jgi:polysaccharide pyruvyl transferase WcaK-like protein
VKQISIIAATFYGNRGAEAMLSTVIAELSKKNADLRFNVFSYYPETDKTLVSVDNIKVYSSKPLYLVSVLIPFALIYKILGLLKLTSLQNKLPESVNALASSKLLLCLAGVSFIDGREKFLPFNIATILPAMLLRVPVVKIAQAMGPFNSFINQFASKIFLSRCLKVFTRGEGTHRHLSELMNQEQKNFERADDIAFLFKPEFCVSQPAKAVDEKMSEIKKQQGLVVGLCPSIVVAKKAMKNGEDYIGNMVNLITQIVQHGYSVVMYPNATRGDDMDKSHNNDLPLLTDIEKAIPQQVREKVITFDQSLNAAQVHSVINSCDIQIVSRFHAMVASLASSVPVMVIGWSHKYLEVMDCFEQGDMVVDHKHGDNYSVIKLLNKLVSEKDSRKQRISEKLIDVKSSSKKQIDYILSLISK